MSVASGRSPRWIANAEKDEGPSHPDTFLSCRSYVNPRCFFAALLIIDHLITIHYTLPILPTLPLRRCLSALSEGIIPAPREVVSEQIKRKGEKERDGVRQQAREGNFFFPPRPATDGHLHIGPLIDKHTGGALRNEGPLPSFNVPLSFIFSTWTAIVR